MRATWISCQLRAELCHNLATQSFDSAKHVPGWYQYHQFLPIEWLTIQAHVAENSAFETEIYHSSGLCLSNPPDPISILLYPVLCHGKLSWVAHLHQGLHCLLNAGWIWSMGTMGGGWHRMDESVFGCLFPRVPPQRTACLQYLFTLV